MVSWLWMLLIAADAPALEATPDLVVAFLGDQGITDDSRAVLRVIREAGTDLVVHAGDLDYKHDPDAWDAMITQELGADFPYLVSIGNHDTQAWDGYALKLEARLQRTPEVQCEGLTGISQHCTFRGLEVLLSGVGVRGTPGQAAHQEWLDKWLTRSHHRWRICTWHKNQNVMQTGQKRNETGWGVYETCRQHGALITTGHEHAYSRTHLVTEFSDNPKVNPDAPLEIRDGATVAWVSGIGGKSVRKQHREGDHWAKIWTSTQGATAGVLLCTFSPGGVVDQADCVFRDTQGREPDRFTLRRAAP